MTKNTQINSLAKNVGFKIMCKPKKKKINYSQVPRHGARPWSVKNKNKNFKINTGTDKQPMSGQVFCLSGLDFYKKSCTLVKSVTNAHVAN